MKKPMVKNKEIRNHLGHNGEECRVRITRGGAVIRYGSPSVYDRSKDHWSFLGSKEEIIKEIKERGNANGN